MGREIVVIVKEGQNVISSNTVTEGSGRPLVIKAKSHQSYELKNLAKGVAPDEIYVIRDGQNLKIKIGKKESKADDAADIIIEEYFEHDCNLIGVAENGQYYNYMPQGADPAASYYSLGGDTLVAESETDWLPIILGVLGAGAIAAAASGGGSDNPPPAEGAAPDDLIIGVYDDKNDNDDTNDIELVGTGVNPAAVNPTTSIPVTNDNTPTVKGHTEAKAEVTITFKNSAGQDILTKTVTANDNGDYKFTPDTALPDDQYYVSAVAQNAVGNSLPGSTGVFEIDTVAPDAPVLDQTDGSEISGTAEAGSTVTLTDGNSDPIGTTTADGNGNFTYTPDTPLTHGTEIVATATDAAGNVSDEGYGEVNSAVPDAPTVYDDVPPVVGDIENNTTTDDTIPTISGSGSGADLPINIYDNGVLLGTTTSDGSGNWSFEPEEPFADGSQHSITYTVNEGPESPSVQFTVDTTPPDFVTLVLTDDVAPITGIIDDNGVTDDTQPTFSGATEAGATVTIKDGDTVLGTVTADASGNYEFTPTVELSEGAHSVTATATDAAGNSVDSATTDFTIQTSASDAAVAITGIADDTGIAGDFITGDNTLVFSGTNGSLGDGEKVQISLDGGNTWMDVDQNGTQWSYDNTSNSLADGTYEVEARVVDAAGNVGSTDTQSVVVDTAAPTSDVAITGVADDTGIAGDFITADNTLVFSGTNGTLGNDEKVQISLDGGNTWMDTTKTDATHWSYNNTSNTMTDGTYTVQARVIDAAGNVGSTDSQSVVVDTVAPTSTVTITAIAEDTGIAGDFITNDNTLVFSGTNGSLGNGEKVQISLDGGNTWMDTTKTDATHWSYNNTSNTMTDGTYTVQARVIDAAGNVGSTDSQSVVVDTVAPTSTVTITAIADDTGIAGDFITADNTLVFSGTNGTLGNDEKVQISLDGGNTWMDTTKTDATHWSYNNTSNTMTDGTYTVQA
ncbi:Ig-like domain-containing protein, partial [Sulfurovum sp.]|uniref:Ig-like domain-containing protein n=1 Tax=Sulfurovum sp. TaxID=1969726 RepID=UPI002A360346